MNIYVNYSIEEILKRTQQGGASEEFCWLRERVDAYEAQISQKIAEAVKRLRSEALENPMRWITENVDKDIQYYVRCEIQGKPYHVLMRNLNRWKKISDIGITVLQPQVQPADYNEWIAGWKEVALKMKTRGLSIYETHAHYDHEAFDQVRDPLVSLVHQAGIERCIIPAIGFKTCFRMKEMFDQPQYDWISYAFGSHPKYLWKEQWTEETWEQLDKLARDPRCIAIGEAGLDYSYQGFDDTHRQKQQLFFHRFIELANKHKLPLILHIRPADAEELCEYDADADAISILQEQKPLSGAVVHCFGGGIQDVCKYMQAGARYFGIGGRICRGEPELEQAVTQMPEESILLETDAPYIKLESSRKPNTSLILLQVAERIAALRGTTVEHILKVTYANAQRLFGR